MSFRPGLLLNSSTFLAEIVDKFSNFLVLGRGAPHRGQGIGVRDRG